MTQLYGLEGASRVHQVQAPRWTAETSFWILSSTQKLTFYVVQEYFFFAWYNWWEITSIRTNVIKKEKHIKFII